VTFSESPCLSIDGGKLPQYSSVGLLGGVMTRPRVSRFALVNGLVAALLSFSLAIAPTLAAPSSPLGTVVYADRAQVGAAVASVGATVFGGDRLSTDQLGGVQIRAGAARLQLASSTIVTLMNDDSSPAATLALGSATFSTANSKAFSIRFANALIRPATDQPTIGRVTVLGAKEFIVKSTRGSLTIAVEDDVREIPEGAGYRIVLDRSAPAAEPQGPRGAGTSGIGGPPVKAARNKFIWYAIAVTAVITYLAVSEAPESPDRP
jgi:hypothetical protein